MSFSTAVIRIIHAIVNVYVKLNARQSFFTSVPSFQMSCTEIRSKEASPEKKRACVMHTVGPK